MYTYIMKAKMLRRNQNMENELHWAVRYSINQQRQLNTCRSLLKELPSLYSGLEH